MNQKKVFVKGDYYNDPDNAIYLVVYTINADQGSKQYTDALNEKFTDEDIKYTIKSNGIIMEIYARENYVINNNINYAYIMDKAGYIHVVNIIGPKDKEDDISKLVAQTFLSLTFYK